MDLHSHQANFAKLFVGIESLFLTAGTLDLFPLPGKITGAAADLTYLAGLLDWDKDFNGYPRLLTYRGAYSDDGVNPGWQPALQIIP